MSHQVRLVCSAEAPCRWLFATDQESQSQKHFARVLIGDLDINVVSNVKLNHTV